MSYRIIVYDSRIAALSLPGGDLYNWLEGKRLILTNYARAYCPKRTGELAASIHSRQSGNGIGTYAHIYADAPYAHYVHEGTHGARAGIGNYMKFRGWGPWAAGGGIHPRSIIDYPDGYWRLKSVRGQESQPFLRRAGLRVFGA